MNRSDLQAWLDRYIEAWRANDAAPIEALFSEDAVYRWNPYGGEDHTVRGRAAIVNAWLDEQDDPASWEAAYTAYAVDEDRAVATGTSRYFATADEPERTFHNVFLMRFAPDGLCTEFTELFMLAR